MTDVAIEVQNLTKVYREKSPQPVRALDGFEVRVQRGEIFGLLGRNGAGKTTLVRILTTLIQPTSGHASILGWDVQHHGLEVRRNIAVVLQEHAVEQYLSVRDNLATYARFRSIPSHEVRGRSDRVIEQFGLGEFIDQKVIDLSGGLKRRVQVAKVFMVETPVVFLDEATTGMDPIHKRATLEAIRDQARLGRTIFLTTHILQEAEELCDSIGIIDHGKLLAWGNVQTIKALASRAIDIRLTFETLTDAALEELRKLPVSKFSRTNNSVEICWNGEEIRAIELITDIAKRYKVVHFEANSATLEDAFVELLGRNARV
jgi:ABC-2 type transport system ATP-binding protein